MRGKIPKVTESRDSDFDVLAVGTPIAERPPGASGEDERSDFQSHRRRFPGENKATVEMTFNQTYGVSGEAAARCQSRLIAHSGKLSRPLENPRF
jgi:hypothetical protein